ncbi:uncharacterized protein BP5553_04527 [Venustampulla echinocandica]|uniref:SP-RING-type domain-containing protein n=1 Tax=Venustampulla echinocandica TaxID=2656787 RepID=A0A370TNJ9_9HELO|nr:uncharacterized protein BP5553_04527 [Venustampulla echinocandica]RDL37094.1 hypothetical protein BP5553_04527 [Venustampulla echinocandica]
MASRKLVARSRLNQESSPARSRQRHSEAGTRQSMVLPPYQPPSCALTPSAKRALEEVALNHDYSKYKKHLQISINLVTDAAVSSNDRLAARKEQARKQEEKRKQAGLEDEKKTEDEIEAAQYVQSLDKRVDDVTTMAEKALRELIDYGDELAMQGTLMREVGERIERAPAPRRRGLGDGADEEEDANTPAAEADVLSPVELLKQARDAYEANYRSKSMKLRYDVNDYRNFKRTVHDAQHPGPDAQPVPHASTWFPEDNNASATPGSRRRRRNNTTDNINNEDDDDDDVVIQRATTSLKDIFTLQYFKDPVTSNVCNHTFEEAEFLRYHASEGAAFGPSSQRARGRMAGPKKVKCPQSGCEAMLEPSDFYADQLVKRQVERAKRLEAAGDEDVDEYDGTHRSRAEEAGSDDDGIDIDG